MLLFIMRKLVLLFLSFFLSFFLSCELYNNNLIEYLTHWTNTAAIDSHTFDTEYPLNSDEVVNISSDGDKLIVFKIRNPQKYTLIPSITWGGAPTSSDKSGSAPIVSIDYTLIQSEDRYFLNLLLKESFLTHLELQPHDDNIEATISLLEPDSGRIFGGYSYKLIANSVPLAPTTFAILKNTELPNWVLAFNLYDLDSRKGIHGDIVAIRISGVDYPVTIFADGTIASESVLSLDKPFPAGGGDIILEDAVGQGYSDTDDVLYFTTSHPTAQNPTLTLAFVDDKGLVSEEKTISTVGLVRSHYYVNETTGDDDQSRTGTIASPYKSVGRAITQIQTDIFNGSDPSLTYTININGTISLADGIEKEGPVVVNGTDDAMVEIEDEGTLNILIQGESSTSVGAINANNKKRLLYISGSNVNVTLGNHLTLSGGNTDNGGGVYVERGHLTVAGATISGNSATINGGGVYIAENATFSMASGVIGDQEGSTSNANNSEKGGGLYLKNTNSTFLGGYVSGNQATSDGGGLYCEDSIVQMSGQSVISKNKTISGSAGGFYLSSGTLSMADSAKIQENIANYQGGGVHIENGEFSMAGNSLLYKNESQLGGGLYIQEGHFIFSSGSINENIGDEGGGGFYLEKGSVTMDGGTIGSNEAPSSYGGGVRIEDGHFILNSGIITLNETSAHGGGVYLSSLATFTMRGGEITKNKAVIGDAIEKTGGGVYLSHDSSLGNSAIFNLSGNPIIQANVAGTLEEISNLSYSYESDDNRGIIYLSDSLGTSASVGVTPHSSSANSIILKGTDKYSINSLDAAKFISDLNNIQLLSNNNNLIVANVVNYYIAADGSDSLGNGSLANPFASIQKAVDLITQFSDNTITYYIHIKGEITNEGKDAGVTDGFNGIDDAMIEIESTNELHLVLRVWEGFNGSINANNSKRLLYIDGENIFITIEDGIIFSGGHLTSGDGAGIKVNNAKLYMNGGLITGNNALGSSSTGGGIALTGENVIFTMNGGEISSNSSAYGGGVAISSGTFSMNGGIISNNTVTASGGGIFIDSVSSTANLSLSKSPIIKDNTLSDKETKNNIAYLTSTEDDRPIITLSGTLNSDAEIYITPYSTIGKTIIASGSSSYPINQQNFTYFKSDILGIDFMAYNNNLAIYQLIAPEIYINNNGTGNGLTIDSPMGVKTQAAFAQAVFMLESPDSPMWVVGTINITETQIWKSEDVPIKIKRNPNHKEALFNLSSDATFTLENLIIDGQGGVIAGEGRTTSEKSLIVVNTGSKLILNSGAFLQNNKSTSSGGAVYVDQGVLEINSGAKIISNSITGNLSQGAGIYLNESSSSGPYSTVKFFGGNIESNISNDFNGGGIFVDTNALLEMTGDSALITKNQAQSGAGIYLRGGEIKLSAGTIFNNNRFAGATFGGGGIYCDADNPGIIKLSGDPKITSNGIVNNLSSKDNLFFPNSLTTTPIQVETTLTGNSAIIGLTPANSNATMQLVQGNGYITDSNKSIFILDRQDKQFELLEGNLQISIPELHYHVKTDGDDVTGTGELGSEFATVQKAVNEIILLSNEGEEPLTQYFIHINGTITNEGEGLESMYSDIDEDGNNDDAMVEIESDNELYITIQGLSPSKEGIIDAGATFTVNASRNNVTVGYDGLGKRVLAVKGSKIELTLGANLTLRGGNPKLSDGDWRNSGGGIHFRGKKLLLTENTKVIYNLINLNADGGGIDIRESTLILEGDAAVEYNFSKGGGSGGGGICISNTIFLP